MSKLSKHKEQVQSLIAPSGRESASLMIVGDWGFQDEFKRGEAFSSPSVTNHWLGMFNDAGFRGLYTSTYRTYLYKVIPPPHSRKAKDKNSALRIAEAIVSELSGHSTTELLHQEVVETKPRLILATGPDALNVLTGYNKFTKLRGSVLPLRSDWAKEVGHPVRVGAVYGPKEIWVDHASRFYTINDLRKLIPHHENFTEYKEPGNIWICKDSTSLKNYLNRSIRNFEFSTFDIETLYGIPTCIGLCFDGKEAVCVPLLDRKIDVAHATLMWMDIGKYLASSKIPKVNQNIKYDQTIMERFFFPVNQIVGDTMLAAHTLYPEFPKGLDFLTSLYTDMPYYKDEGKEFDPEIHSKERLYIYNAKDALVTHQIYSEQQKELKEEGLWDFYQDRVMPLYFLYKDLDGRGFQVDTEVQAQLRDRYEIIAQSRTLDIQLTINIPEFNPLSPAQCKEVIYEMLGFKKTYRKNANGELALSTDEDTLDHLIIHEGENNKYGSQGLQILRNISSIRKIYKILQILDIELYPDGTFRSSAKLHGTENGRTSFGKCIDRLFSYHTKKTGKRVLRVGDYLGNTYQCIPKHGFKIDGVRYGKDIRMMFVPRRGHAFIEVDKSQAEARVVEVLADNLDFLPEFDRKPGVHCLTGSWLFDCAPQQIIKGTDEYADAKTFRHGGNYDMGVNTLMLMTQKPKEYCAPLLVKFHEFSPRTRGVFHQEIRDLIRKNRQLITPHGRRRQFFGRVDDNLFKEAFACIPQGVVSDDVKFSALRISEKTDSHNLLLYEGHDALLWDVPVENIGRHLEIVGKEMTQPIDFRKGSVYRDIELVIPIEKEIGRQNWYHMEHID
jgi:DNA polymerase I-like protein with 3'-5' exonuclease and polymerase domains